MFGEFVRAMRKRGKIGLRQFCLALDVDPSNWSKIERRVMPPPKDPEILAKVAEILGIQRDSDEWSMLHDRAALERGEVPRDSASDEKLVESLPLFFRTLRGQKPTADELRRLAELLRRS